MYDLVKTTAQPYPVLMILLGLAILFAWRKRDGRVRGLLMITTAWLGIYLISTPIVTSAVLNSLRRQYLPPAEIPSDLDAIVTLGGGIEPPIPFREHLELDGVSFGRCLHTAAIYRYTNDCKVIVCGGLSADAPNGPTVAEVMRDTLVKMGVDETKIVVETNSRSTHENAANAAEILRRDGLKSVALVTDARHMPRSVLCFQKQGIPVIPIPSDLSLNEPPTTWYEAVLPSCGGLRSTEQVIHEWIGMAWYWMRGRI